MSVKKISSVEVTFNEWLIFKMLINMLVLQERFISNLNITLKNVDARTYFQYLIYKIMTH